MIAEIADPRGLAFEVADRDARRPDPLRSARPHAPAQDRSVASLESGHGSLGRGKRRPAASGRRRGRRVRRAVRRAQSRDRSRGAPDARRPAQFPPLPAAALPGRDRRAVARRHRPAAALGAAQAAQHDGHPRRGGRHRSRDRGRSCWPTAARSRTTRSSSRPAPTTPISTTRSGRRIAPGLKTIEDATEIRRRILIAFEAAEREADPDRRRAWMTFVLVGGGPTGVELAGALGEIAHDTLRRDFRAIRPEPDADHPASRRWTGSCRPIRRTARRRRNASWSVSASRSGRGTRVTHIDEDGVRVDRTRRDRGAIAARTVFWAAGVLGAPVRADRRRGDRRPDRSLRAGPRRAGPDDPRAPGDLRRRRRRGAAVEARQADAGRRAGRDAGRHIRRQGHPAAGPRPAVRAVPVQRPRRRRGHRPAGGRHQHRLARPVRATGRFPGLGAVARHPHLLPDRVLEPDRRARPLGMDVPDPRPRRRG